MSFQPPTNLYSLTGTRPEAVEVPFPYNRDPLPTDNLYPIGKKWVNVPGNKTWTLTSFVNNMGSLLAQWQLEGSAIGDIRTITGNTGGAVAGDVVNQNVNFVGASGQVVVTGDPSTNTLTISLEGGGEAIDTIIPGSGINVVPDASGNVNFPDGNGIATVGSLNTLTTNMASPFTGDFRFTGTLEQGIPQPGTGNFAVTQAGNSSIVVNSTVSGNAELVLADEGIVGYNFITDRTSANLLITGGSFGTIMTLSGQGTSPGLVTMPGTLAVGAQEVASNDTFTVSGNKVSPDYVQASVENVGTGGVLIYAFTGSGPAIFGSGINGVVQWVWGMGIDGGPFVIYQGSQFGAGQNVFSISRLGAVTFNDAFTFPTTDGTLGQTLVTDGTGTVTWGPNGGIGSAKIFGVFTVPAATGSFSMGNALNVVSATCTSIAPNVICQINFASSIISGSSSQSNTIVTTGIDTGNVTPLRYVFNSATQIQFTAAPSLIGSNASFSIFQNP